jgi:glycosyltransferase involved in cell wall biosynthesis
VSVSPIRVLAVVEAATVTGPAKNLIDFYRTVQPWANVDLSVATFVRRGADSGFTEAALQANIPLIRVAERGPFDPAVIGRLRAAIRNARAQIVQTHSVKSHFLIYLSGIWKSIPWVAFHHGYTATDAKMLLYNQLDRVSLRAPACVVTVSRAFERQVLDRGVNPARITVLHNAVDPAWAERVQGVDRNSVRQQAGLQPGERTLVAIGRMSREKGHIGLIAAFRRLREQIPDLRLVLVGDGPERPRLEKAAGKGVLFSGQVHDVAPYYAIADVIVLPSHTEGSSNVLLEAMAAGVPAVATQVGGTPEIAVNGESAMLVPPDDSFALASAIERVLRDGELRSKLVANARMAVAQRHSPERRARALTTLYQTLITSLPGPSLPGNHL